MNAPWVFDWMDGSQSFANLFLRSSPYIYMQCRKALSMQVINAFRHDGTHTIRASSRFSG